MKYDVLMFRELGSVSQIKDFSHVKIKGVIKHNE